MTDFEIEVILDQARGFRPMLLAAAFEGGETWRNTYRMAAIPEDEADEIRAYLVEAYGPEGDDKGSRSLEG